MIHMRRSWILAAAAVAVFGCTAVRQQKALRAVPDNAEFHNLQVLPANITRDQLTATMRGFTAGLGVTCDHCHARKREVLRAETQSWLRSAQAVTAVLTGSLAEET